MALPYLYTVTIPIVLLYAQVHNTQYNGIMLPVHCIIVRLLFYCMVIGIYWVMLSPLSVCPVCRGEATVGAVWGIHDCEYDYCMCECYYFMCAVGV